MGVAYSSNSSVSAQLVTITATGSPSAGQIYTLTCVGSLVGNTSIIPVVTWSNSTGVVPSGNVVTVSSGNLTFNLLRTSNGGQYTCLSTLSSPLNSTAVSVMNIIVQSKHINAEHLILQSTSLPTVPPPTVTITSTPITTSYYAGTPLNLSCTVQLLPQVDTPVNVTAVWYRGGPSNITVDNYTTISPLSITSSSSHVTTLTFNPLGTADSGWYYCNASVQPGAPYIISGVGGGSLSLQVLGQWY